MLFPRRRDICFVWEVHPAAIPCGRGNVTKVPSVAPRLTKIILVFQPSSPDLLAYAAFLNFQWLSRFYI
ncbi:MAG: hypothetical protein HN356_05735 [Calditrichaeota bacterium]|nr:hypothetical protein [Calditrichota bacterium]